MGPAAEPLLKGIADHHYGKGKSGYDRKPEAFVAEYERLFAAIRHKPLRILELGVHLGESLLIWKDYFPSAVIVGIDIGDRPQRIAGEPRIHFIKGSQDDAKTLDAAAAVSGGPFDIIIDDASHIGYLTKRSLYYLFPRWLKPGGYYVIEDIGAAFLTEFPDGARFPVDNSDEGAQTTVFPSHQHGILGVVKQAIDQAMKAMMTESPSVLDIERITILANIAIIRKKRAGQFKTREERQKARARFEARFKAADKNGDGGLSRAELAKARSVPGSSRSFDVMDANFDAMDADKDGKVTLAERDAWIKARAAEKKKQ